MFYCHLSHTLIFFLFQKFDHNKYEFIKLPELQNNNTHQAKKGLSLAALRIDDMGGIYLNPLLDPTNAYFKCYVAEDVTTNKLIGYILFFNTLNVPNDQEPSRSMTVGEDIVAVVEDLYVRPEYRNIGVATQLLRKVLKVSVVPTAT